MLPGGVRPASLPCRLERQAKPTPVLWQAAAAQRGAARCGRRRQDRSFSCCINQLDSAELVGKAHQQWLPLPCWRRRDARGDASSQWTLPWREADSNYLSAREWVLCGFVEPSPLSIPRKLLVFC